MEKPVLVTTEFRGVFFGYLKSQKGSEELILTRACNCLYWSLDTHGFLGLAAKGPTEGCKLGNFVEEIKLYKITSITKVSKEAEEKWLKLGDRCQSSQRN